MCRAPTLTLRSHRDGADAHAQMVLIRRYPERATIAVARTSNAQAAALESALTRIKT
jgi:hypothetical protein